MKQYSHIPCISITIFTYTISYTYVHIYPLNRICTYLHIYDCKQWFITQRCYISFYWKVQIFTFYSCHNYKTAGKQQKKKNKKTYLIVVNDCSNNSIFRYFRAHVYILYFWVYDTALCDITTDRLERCLVNTKHLDDSVRGVLQYVGNFWLLKLEAYG